MELRRKEPPREFTVGDGTIVLRDCGELELAPDEQITIKTPSGTELDVVRKSWGYYGTPSMNGRLREHGLRSALVVGENGKAFLHLVEEGREDEFRDYIDAERMRVVAWLDSDEAVAEAVARLDSGAS